MQTETQKKNQESKNNSTSEFRKSPLTTAAAYLGLNLTRDHAVTSVLSRLLPIPNSCARTFSDLLDAGVEVLVIISECRAGYVLVRLCLHCGDDGSRMIHMPMSLQGYAHITSSLLGRQAVHSAFSGAAADLCEVSWIRFGEFSKNILGNMPVIVRSHPNGTRFNPVRTPTLIWAPINVLLHIRIERFLFWVYSALQTWFTCYVVQFMHLTSICIGLQGLGAEIVRLMDGCAHQHSLPSPVTVASNWRERMTTRNAQPGMHNMIIRQQGGFGAQGGLRRPARMPDDLPPQKRPRHVIAPRRGEDQGGFISRHGMDHPSNGVHGRNTIPPAILAVLGDAPVMQEQPTARKRLVELSYEEYVEVYGQIEEEWHRRQLKQAYINSGLHLKGAGQLV